MNMTLHLHTTACCRCLYLLEDSCIFVVIAARRTNACNDTFCLEDLLLTVTMQGPVRAKLRALLPELLVPWCPWAECWQTPMACMCQVHLCSAPCWHSQTLTNFHFMQQRKMFSAWNSCMCSSALETEKSDSLDLVALSLPIMDKDWRQCGTILWSWSKSHIGKMWLQQVLL